MPKLELKPTLVGNATIFIDNKRVGTIHKEGIALFLEFMVELRNIAEENAKLREILGKDDDTVRSIPYKEGEELNG